MLGRCTLKAPFSVRQGICSQLPLRLHVPQRGRKMASAATAPSAENRTESGIVKDSKTPSAVLHRTLKTPPRQVTSADGRYLTFSDGHTILDSTCGAAVACIGYNNKRVKKAMVDQMDKFAYCNSMFFGHPIGEELASELVQGTGGVMSKAYITCSGGWSFLAVYVANKAQAPRLWSQL